MTPHILRHTILAVALALATPVAAAPSAYAELVAKAEQGDTTIDFTALRLSYPYAASYDPYGERTKPLLAAAWAAFQAKDCAGATAKAKAMLAIDYLSVPMHAVLQHCLEEAGDTAGAAREVAIGRGIAKSVLGSGDGRNPKTAYVVVSLSEEGLVEAYLGIKPDQQALVRSNERMYDYITGHDSKTGQTRSLYFDVTAILVANKGRRAGRVR